MKLDYRFFVCSLLLFVFAFVENVYSAPKTVMVLPFESKVPKSMSYLEKAVPAAVQSRLANTSNVNTLSGQSRVSNAKQAQKAMGNADYAVWGSLAVQGNDAIVTMHSVAKNGQTWSRTERTPVSALNATVSTMTQALTRESLGLAGTSALTPQSRVGQNVPAGHRASRDIVVNETSQQYYLNPQFRYQGAGAGDQSRLRSQRLKHKMNDMAVGDFNGDGKNEIAILDAHKLMIYFWEQDGRLKELSQIEISQSNRNFLMRTLDLNRDGVKDFVITTYDESRNRPYTFFYTFKGNRFSQLAERCTYFCSVVRLPPSFSPMLVGQKWDSLKLFAPGVYNMVKSGNTYALGTRLNLPKEANVFNFCYLPASRKETDKLVVLRDDERLKIFSGNNNSAIHTTMEKFSGSAVGMDHYKGMPGMGVDRHYQLPDTYYAPMRFVVADIGHTGEYVLLVNKPISTAAQFFERYRYFPQGEVHALYWDGVGLGLKWKTRRIRGSVGQIDLADVNNDGVLDLVVGLNSSPDLGIGSRQCMITAYPLNMQATNPNAPIDMSDFEVTPGR
ncbi:MAG: VCBS repeat-containing protein [Desulfovibrio sp.]|nr:VCBS repeat-containing protein [Desulfovibrio sp.]